MRAIVVDHARAARNLLKSALVLEGFEGFEAGDGREALEQLERSGPLDLALVDWNMPAMTGYELVCEVRSRKELTRMATMMVSTEAESTQVQKALDAGANEYVMKPYTGEVIREELLLLGLTNG